MNHEEDQASPRMRHNLYQPTNTKICYFYRDGDVFSKPFKMAVNPRYYHGMDFLERELTRKIKNLDRGCRAVFTPMGRDKIHSIDHLEDEGKYICSSNKGYAKGIDVNNLRGARPWHGGRAPSGRRSYAATLRESDDVQVFRPRKRPAWEGSGKHHGRSLYSSTVPKKCLFMRNGDPSQRHIILLNRKTAQTFEQVMDDLSSMFGFPIRKLFTVEGRKVRGISGLFNGPDTYVVAGVEAFKPSSTAMSDPGPLGSRASRASHPTPTVHQRLREKRERQARTRGKWKVTITTNELPSAGTQAQVTITVYGHKGNSGPIPLGFADGQTFQSGHIDEFDISVGNIGEIYKIRIAHDNSGEFPGWFCDEVQMRDQDTDEELVFRCQRWLSRDEDDGEICRELPAVRDGQPLPVNKYEVTVVTGDIWNAGTSSNVYITIYGEKGDTGVRQLIRERAPKPFMKGQSDTFTLEAVSLGKLKRVIVGHDGTGPGSGWFLDKIIVKESSRTFEEHTFLCNRWLDEGEDDAKIVRELKPQEEYTQDIMEKELFEYDKWKFDPHNQIILYSKTTQKAVRIKPDATVDALGEESDPLAIFTMVNRRGVVRVFQSKHNKNYHLAIDGGKTLGQGKGGAYCEFRIRMQPDRSIMLESVKHPTQHLTFLQNGRPGDPRGLGNSPAKEFFVYCKGMFRESGVIMLCTSLTQTLNIDHDNTLYGTGKRNRLAQFKVYKVEEKVRMFESVVFPGQYIRMKDGQVDCQGTGDESCQFKVERVKEKGFITLESINNRGIFIGLTPEGKVRPTVDTGDKNVRFYPVVIEFGKPKFAQTAPREPTPPPVKPRKSKKREQSPPPVAVAPPTKKPGSADSVYDAGDWKVWITTDEMALHCEVAMVVYGGLGNSGPITLGEGGQNGLFLGGHKDEFKINLKNIGKIFKIRLELQPESRKKNPSWKVKEVKMQDMLNKDTLKFKFNRWLSRIEDDQDISRELPAVWPKEKVRPVYQYIVMVYTGLDPGSDTDANVFITLFGESGDTGKRELFKSDKSSKFQEGQVDVFKLEAVSLGKLTRCVIGHDGEGKGEGWFCQKVVVRESQDADKEYVFLCNRWLDSGIDDGKTERVLKVKEPAPSPIETDEPVRTPSPEHAAVAAVAAQDDEEEPEDKPKPGEWSVWVTTGKEVNMSTENTVMLHAYGKNSDICVPLGSGKDKEYFRPGATDEFKVDLGTKVTDLYKIRIGHDEKVQNSGWYVEKVKMKDLTSQEQLMFKVNHWMSRTQEDLDVWRELPVVRPGKAPLPVVTYVIEVYTGSEPGSDTEADVYINMYGKRGDSGNRLLYKSLNNSTKFQDGQMDTFELQAVDLDELTHIIVGHNDPSKGAGWYLDKIIIKEGHEPSGRQFYFPCERWFDAGQEDGKIEREIKAQEPPASSRGAYKVWIKTATDSKQPNGSHIVLTAYGEKGCSKDHELGKDKPAFKPGKTDEFDVDLGAIGDLYKIRIGRTDGDAWDDGWHLEEVKMQDVDTGEEFVFRFDRWMDRKKDDHDIVRELPVTKKGKPVLPVYHYEVEVHTGDHWAAQTDAKVYMTLYGSKGDSGKRWLYHALDSPDKFQKNEVDTFIIEAVTLEDLKKVVIGHDGKGHGAGWFLEKVVVREKEGDRMDKEFVFPCGRWLDDHEDDRMTERELPMLDVRDPNSPSAQPKPNSRTQGQWRVKVCTSDIHNAGTHSQVYLTVYGDKGVSNKNPLGKADPNSDMLERGKEAEFTINVGDIGDIFKIRVEHDNKNAFPAWHLEQIIMTDLHTEQELRFFVNRWLAEDEDDCQLCREIAAPHDPPLPVLRYYIAVHTAKQKEATTDANVFITLHGEYGDTGRHGLAESSTNNLDFQPGQVDVFMVEAVSLGRLDRVTLEHDGESKDDAWLVERVVVRDSQYGLLEYIFPCNEWLEYQPRQPACKVLPCAGVVPSGPTPDFLGATFKKGQPSRGEWKVWATTGPQGDTPRLDGKVYITVCGTRGTSAPQLLKREGEDEEKFEMRPAKPRQKKPVGPGARQTVPLFRPGTVDDFVINVGDIGEVYKIRVTIQGQTGAAWNLNKLKMKDTVTGQEFHFSHPGWLKVTEENPQGLVELAAIRPDLAPLPETKYLLSLTTGDVPRAETEGNMYCVLDGEWGDTGKRSLVRSLISEHKFQRGQTDVFEIPALEVGTVKRILIGHDAVGRGRGWYCHKVTLQPGEESSYEILFPCNRWLDTGCNDRRLECWVYPFAEVPLTLPDEAEAQKPKIESKGDWKCWITSASPLTDSDNFPKQGGPVTVAVYGTKGVAGPIELNNREDDMFSQGKIDEFDVRLGLIGEVFKIRVSCGSEVEKTSVWTVKQVLLQDVHTKEQLEFDFSRWVGEVDGDILKELPVVKENQNVLPVIPYHIKVQTGDGKDDDDVGKGNANNSNNKKKGGARQGDQNDDDDGSLEPEVYITLYGSRGDTGARQLKGSQEEGMLKFQPGQEDTFTLEAVDLGELEKVIVTKVSGPDWHLETIVIKKGEFDAKETVFPLDDVVVNENPNEPTELDIKALTVRPSMVAVPLKEAQETAPVKIPETKGRWQLVTKTGSEKGAGTSAEVVLIMCGEYGESDPIHLQAPKTPKGQGQQQRGQPQKGQQQKGQGQTQILREGQEDEFQITIPKTLGDLTKVRLGFADQQDYSSWFVETLQFKDLDSKDEFSFAVHDWVQVNDETDGWKELPIVWPGINVLPVLKYQLEVYTGDRQNAGTNANVYTTVYGQYGSTGKRLLRKSNNLNKFEQEQVDVFEIEAVHLGKPQRMIISHDGKGSGAGWFLDKAVLKETPDADRQFTFKCDRWLDEGEDDKKTERELIASDLPADKPKDDQWRITTKTGKTASPCPVKIVIYGEKGKSDEIPLGTEEKGKFQANKIDQFEVMVRSNLGPVYKIRVGLITNQKAAWFLEMLTLENIETGEKYLFNNKNFILYGDDQDGWEEVPVTPDNKDDALPIHRYEVSVHTGDVSDAGTDSKVYLEVHGERGDTGKRQLRKSTNHEFTNFEQGKIDVFAFDFVDLGKLKKVVVGHDGKGVGSGWFLDKIVIKDPTDSSNDYNFMCNRWLAENEDDGRTERELPASLQENNWQAVITTGKEKNASTKADLIIAIYGENGKSKEHPLVSVNKNKFGTGESEEFELKEKEDIGEPYKIRIGYDPETKGDQSWFLESVKLTNTKTNKEYMFNYKDRVVRTDEAEGWTEIPVHKDKKEDILPVNTYQVKVYTGDKMGAGTDAHVYLTVFGTRGDTGKRHLLKSITYGWNKFESDHMDLFELRAVDLGDLMKVIVGHDGEGSGSGWFLEKIVISPAENSDSEEVFMCGRWLDKGEDDGKIERELKAKPNGEPWKVWTTTGKGSAAGTTNDAISLTLYGDKGKSEPFVIADNLGFSFKDGETQEFDAKVRISDDELGEIYKVRVGFHEPTGSPTWLLDKLKLREESSGKEYLFELNDWVSITSVLDGWREIPRTLPKKEDMAKVYQYQVEVYTGSKDNSGTDADVYIQLFGKHGDTGHRSLLKSKDKDNKFEEGQMDIFEIEAVDLEDLTKVIIGHNGTGIAAGWYLDKIIVVDPRNPDTKYLFDCDRWLDEGEDDGKLEWELKLTRVIDDEAQEGDWRVHVTTSQKDKADTNVQVTLTVFGDKGDSGPLPLGEPDVGLYKAGATDEIDIWLDPKDVGKLSKIRIEHEGKNPSDGWHIEKIVMEDLLRQKKLDFPVNRWLDAGEEDGAIAVELPAEWPGEKPDTVTGYVVQTVTGKEFGGGTDAHVYIILHGEKADSGKRFLLKSKEGKDMFEKGKTDTFTVGAIGLGELKKVTIGHDDAGGGAGWYLDKVIVKETEDAKEQYVFPCDNWLGSGEADGKIERELEGKKEPVKNDPKAKGKNGKGKK